MAEPMYREIAKDLLARIESGEITPGNQLPTELELRDRYSASRNTVRDAIKLLATRGLVESRPGQGTFAVQLIAPVVTTLSADPETTLAGGEGKAAFAEIMRQRERKRQRRESARREGSGGQGPEGLPEGEPHASVPTIEVKFAPADVALRLRIAPGDAVLLRHQEFYIGRTPWALQTTFYSAQFVERGAPALMRPMDIEEGTVKYLNDALGLVQCGYRVEISVRPPDEAEARFFRLPADGRVPLVSLMRTGYEDTAHAGPLPFRVTLTVLPSDRNRFAIEAGIVPRDDTTTVADERIRFGQGR